MLKKIMLYVICIPITFIGVPRYGKLQSDCIRTVASIHPYLPNLIAGLRSKFLFRRNPFKTKEKISLEYLECDLMQVRREVLEKGYSIIPNAISPGVLRSLQSEIMKIEVQERVSSGKSFTGQIAAGQNLVGRYDVSPENILRSKIIRKLAFSKDWLMVGSFVMRQPVVFDGVASWWMFQTDSKFASLNAQAFHADRERLSFLKFFFYLTDIGEDTGPHVYADKTHIKRPLSLRGDRRYSDLELESNGIHSTPILGAAGTVIVANTQGLHKGVPPLIPNHGRLLFEIQVANNLQGIRRRKIDTKHWDPEEIALIKQDRYFEGIDSV